MSKAVKSVGKAVTGVLKGVKKVASKAWSKIKENPVLKTLAIGAAVYFTGGAALSAMGLGSGMAGGAMSGINSAWGALGSKIAGGASGMLGGGSTATGGAVNNIGASVSGAFQGGTAAGSGGGLLSAGAPGGAVSNIGTSIGSAFQGATATSAPASGAISNIGTSIGAKEGLLNLGGKTIAKETAKKGLLDSLGEYGKGQLVASGVSTVGNTISGYAQQRAEEEAEKDYLRRYNRNAWQIG